VRTAAAEALGKLLAAPDVPEELAARMRAALLRLAEDESPWPRRAARVQAKEIGLATWPWVPSGRPETTWRGLPRAREPWPGVDPEGAGEWLTEVEILAIADWLEAEQPLLAFDTTQGTFHVRLEASGAPAHSVSLFNAVRNGLYANTRWHRVVPSFVIQGGDPRGHGGGGGGWTVPDEITPLPFLRGTLGMPKSTKDDGGCQLFFMHSDYHPLDDRYTAYGEVVSGMEVVDRIQVGDLILHARVVRRE
jgi:cyclophilin family peptidyl-prolyl cis-trans isomerase